MDFDWADGNKFKPINKGNPQPVPAPKITIPKSGPYPTKIVSAQPGAEPVAAPPFNNFRPGLDIKPATGKIYQQLNKAYQKDHKVYYHEQMRPKDNSPHQLEKVQPPTKAPSAAEDFTTALALIPTFAASWWAMDRMLHYMPAGVIKSFWTLGLAGVASIKASYYVKHPSAIFDLAENYGNYLIMERPEFLAIAGVGLNVLIPVPGIQVVVSYVTQAPVVIKYSFHLGKYCLEKGFGSLKSWIESTVDPGQQDVMQVIGADGHLDQYLG